AVPHGEVLRGAKRAVTLTPKHGDRCPRDVAILEAPVFGIVVNTVLVAPIGHRQIELAIAIKIAGGDRPRTSATNRKMACRSKRSIAVANQDGHIVGTFVCGS